MSWCSHCSDHHPTSQSPNGFSSCSSCGRILSHHQQTPPTAAIDAIAAALSLPLSPPITSFAHRLFALSQSNPLLNLPTLHRHRRRRRRIQTHLAAVCLYIALRRHRKPLMLIHLSRHLSTSPYSLAAVLALLCKIFKVNHLGSSDPCLFMHRLSSRLLGREDSDVAVTALRIIAEARTKEEKKEGNLVGTCNAALFLAAAIHGHVFSMLEVVAAVSAGLESMGCSGLTVEEFASRAGDSSWKGERESICGHGGSGLCEQCYHVFVEMSALESSKKRRRGDGDDVDKYINSEKERQYKSLIWEEMNREYLEEQLAKKVADLSAVRTRKERKQGGLKLTKKKEEEKRLSSKVNYEVLAKLIGDGEGKRTEMNTNVGDGERPDNGGEEKFEEEIEGNHNGEEEEEEEEAAAYEGYGDGEEGYGEGEYGEYYGDGNEEYIDDDFEY